MKKSPLIAAISALTLWLGGCDASRGFSEGDNASNQTPDPVVVDFPIAYVERPLLRDDDSGALLSDNILRPSAFKPGARLILKARANVPARELVITQDVFPDSEEGTALYDVKDLEPSLDGTKMLFAMRAPEDEDVGADEQPTWNIWEYDFEGPTLRRIIQSDIVAEEGQDVSPHYLPDGRIVFSSTRQRRSRAILTDENKPQFAALTDDLEEEAFVLHIMEEDGEDIEQITHNTSHDLQPTVLDNGKILFLRWDNFDNANATDRVSLYTVNPDGTNPSLVYGYHSQETGVNDSPAAFNSARQLDDGKVLVNLRPREFNQLGGDLITIDIENFTDINQEKNRVESSTDTAQETLTTFPVFTDGSRSPHGYFSSGYPIADSSGRLLVSWSPCLVEAYNFNIFVNDNLQLIDGQGNLVSTNGDVLGMDDSPVSIAREDVAAFPCNENSVNSVFVREAEPLYGLWLYDPINRTQAPVDIAVTDRMVTEAIILEPLPTPDAIPTELRAEDRIKLIEEDVGVVHIHSVYDLDGEDSSDLGIATLADPSLTETDLRPARFLRIMKTVSIPDDDVFDFNLNSADGRSNLRMKDILGYVPIEPDGSVMFKAPADVPLTFAVLNAQGQRISPRHRNWFSLQAGEVRNCTGCHTNGSEVPHGNYESELPSVNLGALANAPFPGTLLLDRSDPMAPVAQLPPLVGETMAQYYTRIASSSGSSVDGARTPNVNIVFEDEWTDTISGLTAADSIDLNYNDLAAEADENLPLTNTGCINEWNSLCRVTINYNAHIEPLWTKERLLDNGAGPEDFTCTSCHNRVDVDGMAQLPPGDFQLELTTNISEANVDYTTSFAELFIASPVLEVNEETGLLQLEMIHLAVDGVLQYFARDEEGMVIQVGLDSEFELEVDEEGQPVPVIVASNRTFPRLMVPGSSRASTRFFNVFDELSETVDHRPLLSPAERKLLYEWLDIGGAYYNNPFDAPPD